VVTATIQPGVTYDLDETIYHAHPDSLSHSGAKRLIPPGSPAAFKYYRDFGEPPSDAFDFGKAAHRLVLGAGPDLVGIDADDWRTKAAKEQRDEARAHGVVPLLLRDLHRVEDMAEALREHPVARALIQPDDGQPEVSLFWYDLRAEVMLRARLDWLRDPRDGRLILVDYKSSVTADPWEFARAAARYGYHSQAAWYSDGAKACGLSDDVSFVFVVQEKVAPYLVSVVELDSEAVRAGRSRNRKAIDLYAHCTQTGHWPGPADTDVTLVSLPSWATREDN
jgi:hypothetical protein